MLEGVGSLKAFFRKSMPVVYIHIGMNKTGTTALQNYLSQGAKSLKAAGILYPQTGLAGEAHYVLSASLGFCNPSASAAWRQDVTKLKKGFAWELSNNIEKVIFSSEDFLLNKPFDALKEFFEGYPVKVVVYLRRHDHWWLSAYAQAVKMKYLPPWKQGPQGFINFNRQRNKQYGDYRNLLDRWAKVVGKGNVIVRPYEVGQNQPDLAADFLRAIGAENFIDQFPRMHARDNVSLPLPAVQLMDIFQRIKADTDTHQKLLAHARSFGKDDTRLLKELVNPQFMRRLVEGYQKDYEYIAREYLGRDDGKLFYEPLPEPLLEWKAPSWPTQSEVAQEVLKVVMHQ